MSVEIPAEILFAQNLASNEKVRRNRALRRLERYIKMRSSLETGGFTETDLLKLWKGLHYCMWMQDKPLIQEELSTKISSLLHSFCTPKTGMLYIKTFYITESREWLTIDKWRMDKFLMMFRNMLTESFVFLKKKNWSEKLVGDYLHFLSDYIILDHTHEKCPDGIKYHLADTYISELEKVSEGVLGPKQTVVFLQPWINMLSGIQCKTLRAFVMKNIFGELLQKAPAVTHKPRKKGAKKLRINYKLVADKLFEVGSQESCLSVNRAAIYNLVQNFRDVATGKLPFLDDDISDEEVKDLTDEDIEAAIKRLSEFDDSLKTEKIGKRKRRKAELVEDDEAYGSESNSSNEEQPPSPPKRKKVKSGAKQGPEVKNDVKSKILSKKLRRLLQAEKEFMEDDGDDYSDGSEVADDVSPTDQEGVIQSVNESSEGKECGQKDGKSLVKSKQIVGKNVKPLKDTKAAAKSGALLASKTSEVENEIKGEFLRHALQKNDSDENATENSDCVPVTSQTSNQKSSVLSDRDQKKKKSVAKQESRIKRAKTSKKQKKHADQSQDFEVEEFPAADVPSDFSSLLSTSSETHGTNNKCNKITTENKNNSNNKVSSKQQESIVKSTAATKKFAEFTQGKPAKAKYFKKAMSQSAPNTPLQTFKVIDQQQPEKKRISFGKSQSVNKTEVKLKGSSSYDPTKTPEQGILKVNPIKPGTVIQVGKQATLRNTLKNSKYPMRMIASDFF